MVDGENRRVLKVRPDYTVERTLGGFSESTRPEGILADPSDLAVDRNEHLIVLDNGGTALIIFDNFGNLLTRKELPEPAHAITTSNDTIFALALSGKEVQLFSATNFHQQGIWRITLPSDTVVASGTAQSRIIPPLLMDIACRNGTTYLLTSNAVYECALKPK